MIKYMSIIPSEYIFGSNCRYNLIGKIEKRLQIIQIGRIRVFEVTTSWVGLKCCQIQEQRVHIREAVEN